MVVGRLAGEDQQLLGAVAVRAVEDPLDLVGLVQVRPVRRERAVLAVAAARPRQRSVRLREKVTRRPIRPPPYPPCDSCSALALAALICRLRRHHRAATGPNEDATLLLDFTPNAVHSGIYLAMRAATTRRRASAARSAGPAPRPTR